MQAMLLSILVLLGAQQPDLDKKVTLESVARNARQIVEILAKESCAPLLCSPAIEGEILIVRFQDVSVKDAMDRMARVSCGKWVKEKDGIRLVRDTERAQREEREEIQENTRLVRQGLSELAERMGPKEFDAAIAERSIRDII